MMNLLMSTAYAQEAGAAAAQQPGWMQFAPMIAVVVIFYFLMLRPQAKKAKEEQAMVSALKKGDEIYTRAGLIGEIVGLTEKVVTIETTPGTKIKVLKSQISGLSSTIFNQEEKK